MSFSPEDRSALGPSPLSLEDLREHLRLASPFASNRVSSLADAEVHVSTIHAAAWQQLVECAEEARHRERGGLGAIVWGDPGVGKSHLLARFGAWVEQEHRGLFVPLHNILSAPHLIPQYLLKCVVGYLAPPSRSWRQTPLYSLVRAALRDAVQQAGKTPGDQLTTEETWAIFRRYALRTFTAHLPIAAQQDTDELWRILFQFYVCAYLGRPANTHPSRTEWQARSALALRALRGDPLEEDEARQLGIRASAAGAAWADPNDQRIESALLILLELARQQGMLIVICFDQVENLTEGRYVELMRFNHALLDHGRNLLIITAGVRTDLSEFHRRQLVPAAAWDRISEQRIDLLLITPAQARELLAARLRRRLEPFATLPEVQATVARDDLFPLGRAWFDQQLGVKPDIRPRDVLSLANQRWREQARRWIDHADDSWWNQWQTTSPPAAETQPAQASTPVPWETLVDERVQQKLQEQRLRRHAQPAGLPPDESNLCGLITISLRRCAARPDLYGLTHIQELEARPPQRPPYDLLVTHTTPDGRSVRTAISVLITENATSAAARYRRMVQDSAPPDRVLIVEDERQTPVLATKGREYRAALQRRGGERFAVLTLTFEQIARLDALESVRADAHSGDLEVEVPGRPAQPISAEQVEQSHHRCGRYREHAVLEMLLGQQESGTSAQSEAAARVVEPLGDEQLRTFVLDELQQIAGASSSELAARLAQRRGTQDGGEREQLQQHLERVAEQLHAEAKLNASPTDRDLYLLLKPT